MAEQGVFFSSLGSGSDGNSFFIDTPEGALLVDEGFSRRELLARMERAGCDPSRLRGALLTHEHSDHAKGARVFCDALGLPLYTTMTAAMGLSRRGNLPKLVRTFEPGAEFSLGGFAIRSFPLSHDVDTVGFHIEVGGVSIGIATDLGFAGENVKRQLRDCHALVLESNYDREMLMNSDRELGLKRRIFGFRGHLDNVYAAGLLAELLGEHTGLLLLAHVSRECNDPEMLRGFCRKTLRELHRDDLCFDVLRQDVPSRRYAVGA